MTAKGTLAVIGLLCGLSFGGNVSAQVSGQPVVMDSTRRQVAPFPRQLEVAGDPQGKLGMARQFMRVKNWGNAIAILEILYEEDPQNPVVQNLLLTCYEQVQYLDKAETLARRRVEQSPNNMSYHLSLAEVMAQQRRKKESAEEYGKALDLIPTFDENRYLIVIRSMIANRLDSAALSLVDSVRIIFGDSTMFALERGSVLEMEKQYGMAAKEYLPLLEEDTTREAQTAERRLLALLSFSESAKPVEKVLLQITNDTNSMRTLKLLTSHYLRSENYDQAFQFALRQDSLEADEGRSLLQYIRLCRDSKAYSQVTRMAEHFLSIYPESPLVPAVLSDYAEGLRGEGRPNEALAVYDQLLELSPSSRQAGEALLAQGTIYYEYLNDCQKAIKAFDSVTALPIRDFTYLKARRGIPYCYLRMGELDKAQKEFETFGQMNLNDDLAEEVAYNLALIDFFEKRYDSADVKLRRLMVEYPRGYYVNDALQLILLMEEAGEAKELLYDYSNALLFEQRLMFDSARARFTAIAGNDNKALADVALYQLADLEFQRQDTTAAMEIIDRLIEEFPESYYQPYGIKTKADVLALDQSTVGKARELYTYLLENHPNYPFISYVRNRLRELEIDQKIG